MSRVRAVPEGFADIETVASYAERKPIVRDYASMAGYARDQVNCAEPHGQTRISGRNTRAALVFTTPTKELFN